VRRVAPARANWYPRNAAPDVLEETLGIEFGGLGGYVAVKIRDLTVLRRDTTVNDGELASSFAVLAQLARCTERDAERVVRFAADAGLLAGLEIEAGRFHCRVTDWERDWERGKQSMRKRRQRSTEPVKAPASPVADQALIDEVVQILTAPREQGCEVVVDPGTMGVANIIRAHPKYTPDEHRQMAHRAAADLANPGYRQRQAHRALEHAYRQHEDRRNSIRRAGGVPASRVKGQNTDRERRQAAREARRGDLSGSSLLQPTVDATATEVT
jgi:hypothetical protein